MISYVLHISSNERNIVLTSSNNHERPSIISHHCQTSRCHKLPKSDRLLGHLCNGQTTGSKNIGFKNKSWVLCRMLNILREEMRLVLIAFPFACAFVDLHEDIVTSLPYLFNGCIGNLDHNAKEVMNPWMCLNQIHDRTGNLGYRSRKPYSIWKVSPVRDKPVVIEGKRMPIWDWLAAGQIIINRSTSGWVAALAEFINLAAKKKKNLKKNLLESCVYISEGENWSLDFECNWTSILMLRDSQDFNSIIRK